MKKNKAKTKKVKASKKRMFPTYMSPELHARAMKLAHNSDKDRTFCALINRLVKEELERTGN